MRSEASRSPDGHVPKAPPQNTAALGTKPPHQGTMQIQTTTPHQPTVWEEELQRPSQLVVHVDPAQHVHRPRAPWHSLPSCSQSSRRQPQPAAREPLLPWMDGQGPCRAGGHSGGHHLALFTLFLIVTKCLSGQEAILRTRKKVDRGGSSCTVKPWVSISATQAQPGAPAAAQPEPTAHALLARSGLLPAFLPCPCSGGGDQTPLARVIIAARAPHTAWG